MINKKIIKGIIPFNDTFYNTCYYSLLFTVLNYYKLSINPIISNDIYCYKVLDEINCINLSTSCEKILDEEHILKDLGLVKEFKLKDENIIHNFKSAIINERPIIVGLNEFYLSSSNLFQQYDNYHIYLIVGYDDNAEHFIAIHDNFYTCGDITIKYSDVFNSIYDTKCKDYYFSECTINKAINVELKPAINIDNYKNTYINNIKSKKIDIINGLEILKNAVNLFEDIYFDEQTFKQNYQHLDEIIQKMRVHKMAERYSVIKLLSNLTNVLEVKENIINTLSFMKALINKTALTPTFNQNHISKLKGKFKEVYLLECEYYNKLFSLINC